VSGLGHRIGVSGPVNRVVRFAESAVDGSRRSRGPVAGSGDRAGAAAVAGSGDGGGV